MTKDRTPSYKLTVRRAVRLTPAEDAKLQELRLAGGGNPISYLLRLAIVEFIRNHAVDPKATNGTGPSMHETTKGDR